MKSIADINQQMNKVQSAIMALNAMNTPVQSVMILAVNRLSVSPATGTVPACWSRAKRVIPMLAMTAQGASVRASLSCMAAVLPGQSRYINHKVNRDERSK